MRRRRRRTRSKGPVTSLKRGENQACWLVQLSGAVRQVLPLPKFALMSSFVGFLLFIKSKEASKIRFRRAAVPRADTAGCQERFKLAGLLTKQHRNKQFNHSSQNMSRHAVTFHWERVTLFLFLCVCEELLEVVHQSCELAVERGRSSTAHLLLFSELLLSVAPIKRECPR